MYDNPVSNVPALSVIILTSTSVETFGVITAVARDPHASTAVKSLPALLFPMKAPVVTLYHRYT